MYTHKTNTFMQKQRHTGKLKPTDTPTNNHNPKTQQKKLRNEAQNNQMHKITTKNSSNQKGFRFFAPNL